MFVVIVVVKFCNSCVELVLRFRGSVAEGMVRTGGSWKPFGTELCRQQTLQGIQGGLISGIRRGFHVSPQ